MSQQQPPESPQFTPAEFEVISLHSSIKAIDGMVNFLFLSFSHNEMGTEARFKDIPHAELFNSLLTDFITPDQSELSLNMESRLDALLRVTKTPQFDQKKYNFCTFFRVPNL